MSPRSGDAVGISTPCGVVPTRRITVVVPAALELKMHGRIYDPMTESYRLSVVPEGNSHHALAILDPADEWCATATTRCDVRPRSVPLTVSQTISTHAAGRG